MSELLDSLKVRDSYGRMYAESTVLMADYELIDHLPSWNKLASYQASVKGAVSESFEKSKKTATKKASLDKCMA